MAAGRLERCFGRPRFGRGAIVVGLTDGRAGQGLIMDCLDKVRLFVRVVETASFSKAGKAEGVVQSTVSKQVAALEASLGAQLLRRTSRSLSVTESGRDFYEYAVGMLADLEAAQSRIGKGRSSPRGRIRATVFADLSSRFIVPHLPKFLADFPEISVDLDVSERLVNLSEEGFDVAIRVGHLSDATVIARHIGALRAMAVASPSYLRRHGEPTSPSDLETHAAVGFISDGQPTSWTFDGAGGRYVLTPRARIRTNDAASIRRAVLAGLGVGFGPGWMFDDDLQAGAVTQILGEHTLAPYPIYAICPVGRLTPGKVKVFIDFVAERLAGEPQLRVVPAS
jgi:LysR family transcriptional regulator for bpeEF and oprC